MTAFNDMLAPPPVQLPQDPALDGIDLEAVTATTALDHPESPSVWAQLAHKALATAHSDEQRAIAYAYARTAYHRSLDRLRANGWKGWGPVPFAHEPNQGVLRAIAALALASQKIGDTAEYERCRQMLLDADQSCVDTLLPPA
ncbi:DUF3151 domain-containing protein [Corynebacterium belfantii]|uniref:DUF3151 domain-containing protein n=1 Tax=Corynebacterium belfantii TaxID=2014537 RepID=UPI00095B63AE|nr:DUF3151 domain-containing protein [Corynebacterium belfantii]OLN14929.1 hypothetical protein BUE64_10205 [Corynebacterium diphtheriae subsp. lausannense]STC66102.1 Protein of uncharacterised function (DUF3151) [Corynebacterium diphtheriae]MBG9243891.1 DUF3151 domain-containing protein [Corynebacterium belfantii]MBG9259751.1 DUF3151 domain-containing protein [Corynebacterium belfantii]MBG9266548.1 DUF3151 domain-containing protein [Corynebacterium belfantii]